VIPIDVNESFAEREKQQFENINKSIIKLTLTLLGTVPDQNFHRSRIIFAKIKLK